MDALQPDKRRYLSAGIAVAIVLFTGCKEPSMDRRTPDDAAQKRGLELIVRTGCGACHEIPGLSWPSSRLGPSLANFGDGGLIAGELPNSPGTLAAFIRDAPSIKPGSPMPPMPLKPDEAADIATYLYGLRRD